MSGAFAWVTLNASLTCTGYVDLGYIVQGSPTSAFLRAAPVVRIYVDGNLSASVPGLKGTVTGEIDVVNFSGRAGVAYRLFRDSYDKQRPVMALYKPFLYYDVASLAGSITVSWQAFGGFCGRLCSGGKTLKNFSALRKQEQPLDQSTWYVYKVATLPSPAPTQSPGT